MLAAVIIITHDVMMKKKKRHSLTLFLLILLSNLIVAGMDDQLNLPTKKNIVDAPTVILVWASGFLFKPAPMLAIFMASLLL
jgi:hypothetical protein